MTCLPEDIAACPCSELVLSKELIALLSNGKSDCLCNECLSQLNAIVVRAEEKRRERPGDHLSEDVDYYLENGFLVFTEYYHLKRG